MVSISGLSQRVEGFPFDPGRFDGVRRQNNDEPVATPQSKANLIMPLLGTNDLLGRKPHSQPVLAKHYSKLLREGVVLGRMRKEDFLWAGTTATPQ